MTEKQLPATPRFKVGDRVYYLATESCTEEHCVLDDNHQVIAAICSMDIARIIITKEGVKYVDCWGDVTIAGNEALTREEAIKKFNQWMEENAN